MKGAKLKTLLSIMIASFLLLSGFVGFWLVQRYEQEKQALTKQLEFTMAETQRQVIDSVLYKTILRPMLGDSGFAHLRHLGENSREATFIASSGEEGLQKIQDLATAKAMSNLKVSVNITDSSSNTRVKPKRTITMVREDRGDSGMHREFGINQEGDHKINLSNDSSNVFLMQGMRLMLGEIAGSNANMNITSDLTLSSDSNLIKDVFNKKLIAQKFDFDVKWQPEVKKQKGKPGTVYLKTNLFATNYQAEVGDIRWYLVGKLQSQLAFIVLMLSVTALAFILAYRSLVRQDKLNTMKNDLINNMSHELKTPVATVKVALEALGDSRVMQNEAVANEYLGMATLELDRLELLLGKVLNSSMLDSKHALINKEALNLNALIEECVKAVKMRSTKMGAEITLKLTETPAIVHADRLHVQGVLLNLIDNALKYGGTIPKVTIELNREGSGASISVSDNGKGIPEEYLGKVFDKFFRVPHGNVHDTKGYGLGLSYARQVMNQHGGSIDVTNCADGGCTFTIHFKS